MPEQFLPFHSFPDPEVANDFAEKLSAAKILFKIEKIPQILSDGIIGTTSSADIIINLAPEDFEKAHEVLGDYYKKQLDTIDKDFYLFGFTNVELYEILEKPDEWGYLDYQLAGKILSDRGQPVDPATLQELKKNRIKELAKPGKASHTLIILGYCFFIFAGIVTILIGRHIVNDKKTLPDGQTVFSYTEQDRKHGRRMVKIGSIYFCIVIVALIIWLIFAPSEQGE